jgi:cellulose biosynthesis protein BcsQ
MMTDKQTKITKTILELVKKHFPNIPVLAEIKRATDIRTASYQRLPISVRAEHHQQSESAAMQFADLTHKIVERIDSLENEKGV